MQIAKELNYSYGYIPGSAFGGNCTVNDYTKQSALDATVPVLPTTWVCRPRLQPATPTATPASPQTVLQTVIQHSWVK